jgi:hypothetical protein
MWYYKVLSTTFDLPALFKFWHKKMPQRAF